MRFFIGIAIILLAVFQSLAQPSLLTNVNTFTVTETSPYQFETIDSSVYCWQEVILQGFVDTNVYNVSLYTKCNVFLPGQSVGVNLYYKRTPTKDTSVVQCIRFWQNHTVYAKGTGFTIQDFDSFMEVGNFLPDKCKDTADTFNQLTGASLTLFSIPLLKKTNDETDNRQGSGPYPIPSNRNIYRTVFKS